MLFEHIIYSTAIAIIAGMLWYKYTGRDPSWIIIASAFAPDCDLFAEELLKKLDMNIMIDCTPIRHGDFHNIAFLLLFAFAAALVLKLAGMRFGDSFLFAGIGFGAHMFEDALVANPVYHFFWPISGKEFGIGIIEYRPDWYGIANKDVLILGLITVLLSGWIRVAYEGKGGINRIEKVIGVAAVLMILMIPVYGILDIKVIEDVNSRINTKVGYLTNATGWPVGGGTGYPNIISQSNASIKYYIQNNASNLTYLKSALTQATSGDIIYINDSVQMNLSLDPDQIIPAGVTLASGRGNGSSQGAYIYSTSMDFTDSLMFKTGGAGVRITGLRLNGTNYTIGTDPETPIPTKGIFSNYNIEVDNTELMGFGHCAVCIYNASVGNIHNNYIHHNVRTGYGYGVAVMYNSSAIIESNIFNWNRHSIAGDGRINTSYIARYNLILDNGTDHAFDMHGGADRGDGTDIAGKTIQIYGNTFHQVTKGAGDILPAINIRGIPSDGAYIYNNYFYYNNKKISTLQTNGLGNMRIYNNCYATSLRTLFFRH